MNGNNPAGNVTQSHEYVVVLVVGMVVSFLVSVKRCWVGLSLGRQTYCTLHWRL